MPDKIAQIIEHHHYPRWIRNRPRRIKWHYRALRILHLRTRVCLKNLRETVSGLESGARILDAGCGEGQYLIPLSRKFPDCSFTGIDLQPDHIQFLEVYISQLNIQNVHLLQGSIEERLLVSVPVDFIYLISVLQYMKNPAQLIRRFGGIQREGGRLLLYTPVEPVYSFRFLEKIRDRYSHYDSVRPRQSIRTDDLFTWIKKAGYRVTTARYYYGRTAALGHAIMQSLLILISHWKGPVRWIAILFFIILSPIFVSLQVIDELKPPRSGNGILLTLEKSKRSGQKQEEDASDEAIQSDKI